MVHAWATANGVLLGGIQTKRLKSRWDTSYFLKVLGC